ncbi:ABC transporter permease [Octadecabacter sp.]|nr:ABC transporter permease [Octadecabacter sp.]MDC1381078.1 ABC transporter permease [Octadecabacter sp.]
MSLTIIAKRLLMACLVIFCVSILTFLATRILPSDPAALYAGPRATPENIEIARFELGLDRPLIVQYAQFAGKALTGDFGVSFRTRQPISSDIAKFLPATLELVILAMLMAVVIGIPLGVWASARPKGGVDQTSRIAAIAMASFPTFWVAMIFQLVFFKWLDWLPLSGQFSRDTMLFNPITRVTGFNSVDAALSGNWAAFRDVAAHLVLPTLTLSLYPIALAMRMTRSAMGEVLQERYITTATAMGISRRTILFRFALKNALPQTLTVLGLTFAFSLTGAVLVEIIFAWPGIGSYVTSAILAVDFPVIMAVTLVGTVIYVIVNLLVDLAQAMLDPRVALS